MGTLRVVPAGQALCCSSTMNWEQAGSPPTSSHVCCVCAAGETLPVLSKGGTAAGAAAVPRNRIPGTGATFSCLGTAARLAPNMSPTALWGWGHILVPWGWGSPPNNLWRPILLDMLDSLTLHRRGCLTSGRCGRKVGIQGECCPLPLLGHHQPSAVPWGC